jgi:pimeloyl-ACP methyl ester carboxylesterase
MTDSIQSQRFLQERELWFACGGHRMRYVFVPAASPEKQPAVVFVHGLLGYSFSWRHNLDVFAQQRDAYAVDLLGIGHSDRPQNGGADFGLAAAASRLLGFLHSLGHSQIDLVATSHGGAVAMMAASLDRASRANDAAPLIRRMALIAPLHPFVTNNRLRIAFFRSPFGRMVLRGLALHSAVLQGKGIGRLYGHHSRVTAETRAGYAVNLDNPKSYEYALEVLRSLPLDMQQLRSALHSIASIPVLLMWGADDRAIDAHSGLLLREFFCHAEYVVLPGVGHLPYEEAPDEFNRRVLHFLDQ